MEYFKNIGKIEYKGKDSNDPFHLDSMIRIEWS